jgi:adenylate cyclase
MNQEGFKRKLTAVLSADVAGFSRLMAEDEASTVKTLETYREVMFTLIKQHRGRVIDSPGDNLLAEFTSVVDAVQCAVAVQKEFQARNSELPENRKMEFRVGVNLGDVIEEGERIYGDGVNIAARLEALADPGGICISKTAFDQIETKLPLGYEFLGEQDVKNIPKPVGAYRVLMEPRVTVAEEIEKEKAVPVWRRKSILAGGFALVLLVIALAVWNFYFRPSIEPASVEKMAHPLPDKPSIAVLAFTNMSGDPDQEYFSDGLTEEIITTLSKVSDLFVIARHSTFTYKGKPVKVKQVAEELGVRYVLEGSVRKDENRVRITAQLIDALTGHHLWAETYDRELKGIFAVQDKIKKKIVTALEVTLTEGEQARLFAKGTDNVEAWTLGRKAWKFATKYSKENQAKARELLESVKKLDPEYPFLWTALAQVHFVDARFRWTKSPAESYKRALEFAKKALTLDEKDAIAHGLLGTIYLLQRQHEKAIAEGQKAIALDPNYADGYAMLSQIMRYSGRFEESLTLIEKGIRLSPMPRVFYPWTLGQTYVMLGRYEEAITVFEQLQERCRKRECPPWWAKGGLIRSYIGLGKEEEARAEVEEYLRLRPTVSLESMRKANPYRDPAHLERHFSALRKAGIPEKPPLPLPDRPSIAVLPFVNLSGDAEQEYFSDGITEEIITALSKVPDLFVIARNSSFTYKGKSVRIPTVGRELGVRYVLEGSVREAGEKVRVTAQLVDAKTGNHLWAERYDRDLKDIFALQDEITMKIITAMQVKLTEGEQARLSAKGTDNLEAYLKYLQAREYVAQLNKEDNALARKLAEEAISLDPEFSGAYTTLGATHWMDIILGSTKSSKESLKRAFELTKKAIALDDSNARSHVSLSFIYMMKRQHDKAIAEAERAVELAPGSADAYFSVSRVLRYAGRAEEAITWNKKAIRQDPMPFGPYLMGLAHAYWMVGRYEEALPACKKAVLRSPKNTFSRMVMVATYISLGREEEARAEAQEVLRIDPKFSLANWEKRLPFKNQADTERLIEALRKAGLK